jgi:hypothetical protein
MASGLWWTDNWAGVPFFAEDSLLPAHNEAWRKSGRNRRRLKRPPARVHSSDFKTQVLGCETVGPPLTLPFKALLLTIGTETQCW